MSNHENMSVGPLFFIKKRKWQKKKVKNKLKKEKQIENVCPSVQEDAQMNSE